ncbi:MAG TPA: NADH-quinone oxidoreductase subunit N [Thermoanaerobaculia bacterium]|jgi:NADH-quinone oxidoreductase subunit N|nr:NADH-quinone oxidoreductase subunit N [Thermoanaerobaculia bacterium]
MPIAPTISLHDIVQIGPELLLAVAGLLLLVAGAIGKGLEVRDATKVAGIALGLSTAVLLASRWSGGEAEPAPLFGGSLVLDGYAFFWQLLALASVALVVLMSSRDLDRIASRASEYYALLLIATAGAMLMVAALDLLTLWIALETMALSSYILAGIFTHERRSNEAAIKYFVLGALSSAILLYGISLLYGATGTLMLPGLAQAMPAALAKGSRIAPLGGLLVAAGLFFKIAAAPFHYWVPDVYVGAPTPITAFLAGASKLASFAVLGRVFLYAFGGVRVEWQPVVAGIAAASMIWGNLGALTQTNVKRLLAYSSIAHAGYLLIGILAASETGLWAAMFYAAAYAFMTIGAFSVVALLERGEYAGQSCSDYAGLGRRRPFLAASMLVFLIGLTGIPPTGGFFGKVFLFAAAVQAGWTWVAMVGVLTSAVSLYFYFRIVVYMYFTPAAEPDGRVAGEGGAPSFGIMAGIGLCAVVTLALGIFPGPLIAWVEQSLLALR